MNVDIVIVNWNSGDYLRKCIFSVFTNGNIPYINKVIVIDNNSKDNSLLNLIENDKLTIIKNKKNSGFAKACNQGFKICNAPYILALNPDAQLSGNTLNECCSFMEKNKTIDILGCQLLDDEGKISVSCGRFPTPISFFYKSTGLSNAFPKIFTPPDLMYDWDHKESRFIDQAMGAFMFIRKEVFEKIGYFDERFFVYSEELDFSKRLAEIGGKSYFNTDIKIIHSGRGTTKSTKSVEAFSLFLNRKSKLLYAKKHFSKAGYLLAVISLVLLEPITRIISSLVQLRFSEIFQIIRTYRMLFNSFFFGKNKEWN